MKGHVDDSHRALIEVMIQASPKAKQTPMLVWIDTAFDGHLVCSRTLISKLGLKSLGKIEAVLADGSVVEPEIYLAYLDWHGSTTPVQVIANEGNLPLLGTQLLKDSVLLIDYMTKNLEVTQ